MPLEHQGDPSAGLIDPLHRCVSKFSEGCAEAAQFSGDLQKVQRVREAKARECENDWQGKMGPGQGNSF